MKNKSYAVLGLGKFGSSVAREMTEAGAEVLAVDIDEERVHEMASIVACAVKADVSFLSRTEDTISTQSLHRR